MIALCLDLLAIVVAVISVILAYKKGFIRTLFSLIGWIVAVCLAMNFKAPVAQWIDQKVVGPTVQNSILTAISGESMEEGVDATLAKVNVAGILREMPEELRGFFESLHMDADGISQMAEGHYESTVTARKALIQKISAPISYSISEAIALILLVVLFFLALFLLSLLLSAVFKVLPLGDKVNHFGGIILGILRACLIIMILGIVANIFCSADVQKSWIFGPINRYNPILNLFS
jgi:uncharacterized membrane protein required for colicin V production